MLFNYPNMQMDTWGLGKISNDRIYIDSKSALFKQLRQKLR